MSGESKILFWIKRLLPYAGLLALTAALMVYFRDNTNVNKILEKGANELASFYTDNLKPLVLKTEIDKEDVINFALHKNLPLDKTKGDLLQIGKEENNTNSYQLKTTVWNANTNNYEKFVEYFNLSKDNIIRLDSILNFYKEDLYSSILFNEQNTIAVNTNLYLLQRELQSELYSFLKEYDVNEKQNKFTKRIKPIAKDVTQNFDNETNGEFLIFTKDSVFESKCAFDKKEFKHKLNKYRYDPDELKNALANISISFDTHPLAANVNLDVNELIFEIDSNIVTAFFHRSEEELEPIQINFEDIEDPSVIHSIKIHTDTLGENLVLNFDGLSDSNFENEFHFEFNFNELKELTHKQMDFIHDFKISDWENFGIKIDSLVKSSNYYCSDSSNSFDQEKFKIEMKKFKDKIKMKAKNLEQKMNELR